MLGDRCRTGSHGIPGVFPAGLLALLLLLPAGLAAQSSAAVEGRVLDPTGAPVPGAVVALLDGDGVPLAGAGASALTDPAGRFRITHHSNGLHRIRVAHDSWGAHELPFQLQGSGTAALELRLSPEGLRISSALLEPAAGPGTDPSPGARNVIRRDRLQEAAGQGLSLGQFLAREVPGMRASPRLSGVGGGLCVEFRTTRGDDACRPPQVYLDGAPVASPLDLFQSLSPDDLDEVQMIPPSQAGSRFGNQGGWGVLLLRTPGSGGFAAPAGVTLPGAGTELRPRLDWEAGGETHPYRWGRVYGSALVGNAAGLAGGLALLSRCMDLEERRIYRAEEHCGHGMLALSAISMAFLPSLGGSAAAHLAGTTSRSTGRMLYSTMAAQALLIPGFALASQRGDPDGGRSASEVAGLVLITVGAPLVNAVVDRLFRDPR